MAVGGINVSVTAETAKAIKNLRAFSEEAKSSAWSAREISKEFRGNTLADYERKFGTAQTEIRRSAQATADFSHTLVDLRSDTNRYSEAATKQVALVRQLNGAMSQLKSVGKAVAVAYVAVEGFNFGQKIRGHIEYIDSWATAWRELKAAAGFAKGGLELEMERLEKLQQRGADRLARQDKQLAENAEKVKRANDLVEEGRQKVRDAVRDRRAAELGRETVEWEENSRKFGMSIATRIAEEQDRQKTIEAAKDAAEKKEEERRQREREHQENLKRDAESIQKIRERILDFGKTDMQAQRDQLLRTIDDAKQKEEANKAFDRLDALEKNRDEVDRMRKDRDTLSRRDGRGDAFLDARTAEGWAALRNGPRNAEIAKLDDQIAVLERIEALLKEDPVEEVVRF